MRYRRWLEPGGRYFFTVVTQGRRPLLVERAMGDGDGDEAEEGGTVVEVAVER